MPLLETKGAASAQGFGEFAKTGVANYIEDVFSTWLYTGNSSTQTITNGIDLAGKGGLVWIKARALADRHMLFDTARGVEKYLSTNNTTAESFTTSTLTAFGSNSFTLGNDTLVNGSFGGTGTYASWTFRKQAKFFDVVTYTGDGTSTYRTISHSLGSTPGFILVKSLSSGNWIAFHRSLSNTSVLFLNQTAATNSLTGGQTWSADSTTVTLPGLNFGASPSGYTVNTNSNGVTYVAYLFAHNAGGFGLTGTDNVISCGQCTGNTLENLGWEPQWVLVKGGVSPWRIYDSMRMQNLADGGNKLTLRPNDFGAESNDGVMSFSATGFTFEETSVYIAIRRGPMKTPTTGTSVFSPATTSSSSSPLTVTTNFPVDLTLNRLRDAVYDTYAIDRLRGSSTTSSQYLRTDLTVAETNGGGGFGIGFDNNTAIVDNGFLSGNTNSKIYWNFRRAPGFFDVVCYTGNNVYQQAQTHNLGVAPELIIVKRRNATANWAVGCNFTNTEFQYLNLNSGADGGNTNAYTTGGFFGGKPTATTFILAQNATTNESGGTYVAYLFATLAGVSKVGTYTGTGAAQTINCGFTGGARFVLIKRLGDNVDPGIGDWYVYDSARGITSGNDPYLLMNSTAAEVTGTNYVDTTSVGFQVTAAAPAGLNANGGTYIYLAIA